MNNNIVIDKTYYNVDVENAVKILGITQARLSQITSKGMLTFERKKIGTRNKMFYNENELYKYLEENQIQNVNLTKMKEQLEFDILQKNKELILTSIENNKETKEEFILITVNKIFEKTEKMLKISSFISKNINFKSNLNSAISLDYQKKHDNKINDIILLLTNLEEILKNSNLEINYIKKNIYNLVNSFKNTEKHIKNNNYNVILNNKIPIIHNKKKIKIKQNKYIIK